MKPHGTKGFEREMRRVDGWGVLFVAVRDIHGSGLSANFLCPICRRRSSYLEDTLMPVSVEVSGHG